MKSLPDSPSLDHLRQQAKDVLLQLRAVQPEATLSEPRIDPDESRIMARDRGLLDRLGDVLSDNPVDDTPLYARAEDRLGEAAAEAGLTARAETNTRRMLEGLLGKLGYDDVTVVFESPTAP